MATCTHCTTENPAEAFFCMSCGNRLPAQGREASKVVTIVFTDVIDSTKLGEKRDPVVLRSVMTSFFATARQVFEEYDGTVQKFVGDAVVAVFGVPTMRDDDPYRAVRAAYSLHVQLPVLNARFRRAHGVTLRLHTAVNTGELSIDDPSAPYAIMLGDAVTVAARLGEQAADGEILITDVTYRMVRQAIDAEQLTAPVALRGRSEPAIAWRLLGIHDMQTWIAPRPSASPLVGRDLDLEVLDLQYRRVERDGRSQLAVMRGDAGVGKSRLVEEFTRAVRGKRNASILHLRCVPGHGGQDTVAPIRDMLRQAVRAHPNDSPEQIHDRLTEIIDDERVLAHTRAVLGLSDSTSTVDELNRALRRVLESLSQSGTVVMVVDDLHYAEPSLLDFIEHVAGSSRPAPILLLCTARLEFFNEDQAGNGWATNLSNHISVSLGPLTASDTEKLVEHLLSRGEVSPQIRTRIVEAAEGNPFFVEEYVAMLIERGSLRLVGERWEATADLDAVDTVSKIGQVLGARLDQLNETERAVIDAAAVIGRQYTAEQVTALVPSIDEEAASALLDRLVQKEFLRLTTPAGGAGHGARERFRFRHGLIQEVAYRRVVKTIRAKLHEDFATWLEQASGSDRTIAFHLEQAYDYRIEVGSNDDEATRELARRAGERLAAAGRGRASHEEPPTSAAALLTRAVELLPEGHPQRLTAYLDLADALRNSDLDKAIETYDHVEAMAKRAGEEGVAMHAALGRLEVQWYNGLRSDWDESRPEIDRAIMMFSDADPRDDLGLAKARRLLANMYAAKGQSTLAREQAELAVRNVERVGDDRLQAQIRRLYGVILFWGPTPLDEVVEQSERAVQWAKSKGMYTLEAGALSVLARAAAMRGEFEKARELNQQARSTVEEDEGDLLTAAADTISQGLIELLAEDIPAAERVLRRGYEALEERHATTSRANVAALLARALLRRGRFTEAEHFTQICERLTAIGQLDTRIKWRGIRAIILARRGKLQEAEKLARAAVKLAQDSEQLDSQAEALVDLAQVLRLHATPAKDKEAARLIAQAAELYRRKGNLVAEAQTRNAAS
jgi:class 3 adenylate cyclase/tetratricopeptide (TPR) repeat protein